MTSIRHLSVFVLLFFSALSWANVVATQFSYYPADFYQNLESGARDAALKSQLFDILSKAHVTAHETGKYPATDHDTLKANCAGDEKNCYQQTVLGYTRARKIIFGEIHLVTTPDGYGILDVYCQHLSTTSEFHSHPPGPGQIPDVAILNAEHTWPQSHFSKNFDRDMQKSDLNILYPVLSHANSSRNNLKFGEVTSVSSQPCPVAKRGHGPSGSETYFEPPIEHKGNVARAIFYFSVRYKLPIDADEEASLRAWNRADPVDDFERHRNEVVMLRQHQRNPFIDHPELVELISDF